MPLDPDPLTVPWFAQPNDLIGGWSVMTVDKPPSQADHRRGEYELATCMSESMARRIAELHNERLGADARG